MTFNYLNKVMCYFKWLGYVTILLQKQKKKPIVEIL